MTKASDNVFPRFLVSEGGSTSTPAAGRVTAYAKADGLLYSKDDAGNETLLSSGLSVTLGPYYINDIPGSATTQAQLLYFNTATAVSQGSGTTSDMLIGSPGRIVGMIIMTDNGRTAGTATARVRIAGTGTTFNSGGCALGASNTIRNSSFVAFANGVSFTAGQAIGCDVVTSGYTPTTGNIALWIVVALSPVP